jgi:hypothetical protein
LTYYATFNINIVDFIDLSEVITSVSSVLILALIPGIYGALQMLFLTSKSDVTNFGKFYRLSRLQKSLWKRVLLYIRMLRNVIFILIGQMTVSLIWDVDSITDFLMIIFGYFIVYTLLLGVITIHFEIDRKHKQLYGNSLGRENHKLAFWGLLMIIFVIFLGWLDAHKVKSRKSTYGSMVTLSDSTKIISDSTFYFVGKTHDYYFFFDENQDQAVVLPKDRVAEFRTAPPHKKK